MPVSKANTRNYNEYATEDLGQAAFLLAHRFPLLRIEPSPTSHRKVFVFPREAAATGLQYYQDAPVPARSFWNAARDLKGSCYSV